ncbi:2-keto-4-pentenoate hydratase/2-oxohepta-3-ene-1,7-dioic acid hydratase in catechol pathway [Actinomadura pelletieri DSM 43383]|uniref:2-keto-4-pentenoate hydratase/2-oxohepta-3-ene-1,7-dioic acid hydratase in catechol pathway n=1 Tax=Actinomadura pelletieri DSM 43383 TaxID=1120940 RepID=A0A495QQ24_9ACTN|nr:fumarylacetoacetate hydrolase family protein [Actinomadura pelletieri]RKS75083.1 2-keto-4-pentenoate hydratase/2-oxohepta-3-ene-1,7-dioic acid hydratase in catechol pathway [Actinomadura pelletieri DSM 43383]
MRIARFSTDEGMSFGVVEENTVAAIAAHPFGDLTFTGQRLPLADVRLLAPILPSKVIAIGKNYADHVSEMGGGEPPAEPVVFSKPSTAVIGPGEAIAYPQKLSERVDFEGELAVVIGRMCREVPASRAADVILGYTCANDVTARDLQAKDGQWTRAKGFDTFCPLGPWIETEADPADLAITTTVNGAVRQDARTSLLLHDVPTLVEYVSQVMTLLPGDVILTGTPAGVGPLEIGDEVTVIVENVGTLTNRVVARD